MLFFSFPENLFFISIIDWFFLVLLASPSCRATSFHCRVLNALRSVSRLFVWFLCSVCLSLHCPHTVYSF